MTATRATLGSLPRARGSGLPGNPAVIHDGRTPEPAYGLSNCRERMYGPSAGRSRPNVHRNGDAPLGARLASGRACSKPGKALYEG
jgi:hypothetical protein